MAKNQQRKKNEREHSGSCALPTCTRSPAQQLHPDVVQVPAADVFPFLTFPWGQKSQSSLVQIFLEH